MRKEVGILCVCNCLLGNRIFTMNFKSILDGFKNVKVDYVFVEQSDYEAMPISRWRSLGMSIETLCVIKRKLKDVDFAQYDLVIAQGFEIAWALKGRLEGTPCFLFADATPVASHHLILKYSHGFLKKLRSFLMIWIYKFIFADIFSDVDLFFPMTQWCGKSFIDNFRVPPEKVCVCAPSIDIRVWKPAEHFAENNGKIKLLFVGNDFKRKGGFQLMEIFEQLSSCAELCIVSNDPIFDQMRLPDGVQLLRNVPHEELPQVFQEADLFVFPTLKEHLGISQVEAAACGLPIISRDVGGTSDVVKDCYNGYLMPYESTEDQWVEKIRHLIDHSEERVRMGMNSRKLAEEMFSTERFMSTLMKAIQSTCDV